MNKAKSLLMATDFSADADRAVRRAAQLAAQMPARLELLHVMNGPSLNTLREAFSGSDDIETRLCAEAQGLLEKQIAALAGIDRTRVTARVAVGNVLEEILQACGAADMLVLGARGLNPLREFILGTTAQRLLRKSTRPVLIAKREPEGPYRRVIVPIDFSPYSVAALRMAAQITPEAEITLLHAFDVPFEGKLWLAGVSEASIQHYRDEARRQALSRMGELAQDLGAGARRLQHLVEHGDARRIILQKEQALNADLIVIGKHGRSMMEELFLGSVTERVLSDSKCDVLVVRG